MAVHVGISPNWKQISYYNEANKKLFNSSILEVKHHDQINKIKSMFDKILSKIIGVPGHLCICLDDTYGDKIRKVFIENGLKSGFKNVEIINWQTALYLHAMSQIQYKPMNNDVIWLFWRQHFYVWFKTKQKAKFIGKWEFANMKKIKKESKLHKEPTVLLYSKNIGKGIFSSVPDCKFLTFDPSYADSKGSLLKARITFGDNSFAHLDVENFFSRNLNVIFQNKEIKFFKFGGKLPIFFSKEMRNTFKDDEIEITTDNYKRLDIVEIPVCSKIIVNIQIDVNEILTINFDDHLDETYHFIEEPTFSTENKTLELEVETLHFTVPKLSLPFNPDINAIGIDLGTSRCCVAVIRQNGIHTVPLDNTGERLLPSYVAYDEQKVKCGIVVVDRLRNFSKSTVFDSKRIIGRCKSSIEIDSLWPFELIETNGKLYLEISKSDGRGNVSAEEVATDLLKQIKQKNRRISRNKIN